MTDRKTFRQLANESSPLVIPGAHDALTARIIEQTGFDAFMIGGFQIVGARYGVPDIGLLGLGEISAGVRDILAVTDLPCLVDVDTGYGDVKNAVYTLNHYEKIGAQAIIIEDQLAPKRCGHTRGKQIVSRAEAYTRIRAAIDARNELRDAGGDILVMARTDANATDGMEEAIERCNEFRRIGVDITFLEAPRSTEEMKRYCDEVDGPKMANMVEQGDTPFLPPAELEALGYKIAIWPAALMLASIRGIETELARLARGEVGEDGKATFPELQDIVGFPDYYDAEKEYAFEAIEEAAE